MNRENDSFYVRTLSTHSFVDFPDLTHSSYLRLGVWIGFHLRLIWPRHLGLEAGCQHLAISLSPAHSAAGPAPHPANAVATVVRTSSSFYILARWSPKSFSTMAVALSLIPPPLVAGVLSLLP